MPEITTTLGQLVGAEDALKRLAEIRLPMKAAYQVAKLVRLVGEETKVFHEQREALIRDLGTTREATPAEVTAGASGGKVVSVTPENWPVFRERLGELAEVKVTVAWERIDLATLGDITITSADLLALDSLVVMKEG